ncbi:MAG: hypothetical protein IT279_05555 [Ignavibacteriaceae bacterium]|nr:hypothetical protein [Ignavibacteriaceae bacterium]
MKFSERIGKTEPRKVLQVDEMSAQLRNLLWNEYIKFKWELESKLLSLGKVRRTAYTDHLFIVWVSYYKLRIDEIEYNSSKINEPKIYDYICNYFFSCEWFNVYNFIEFAFLKYPSYQKSCNSILKNELSAYRFIDGILFPVTSEEEVAEIASALTNTDKHKSINDHLEKALRYLGNKTSPDYHNSIKESVSALEAMFRIISNDEKIILSKAIKKVEMHQTLRDAIEKLYSFTNDQSGVRHSLKEGEKDVQIEDARFILIVCSAIINFLKDKLPN